MQSGFPIKLTTITVSPDPIVGQVVTLHIEAMSTRDEKDAIIRVTLPEEVKLVEGGLVWEGQLLANQPQILELSICVKQEGNWRVWINTASRLAENSTYGDSETLNLASTHDSGRAILGTEYTYAIGGPEVNVSQSSMPEYLQCKPK